MFCRVGCFDVFYCLIIMDCCATSPPFSWGRDFSLSIEIKKEVNFHRWQ